MTALIRPFFRVSCCVSFEVEAAWKCFSAPGPLALPCTCLWIVHASNVLSHANSGFELFAARGTFESVVVVAVHLHDVIAEMIVAIVVSIAQLAFEASIGVVHAALVLH